MCDNSFLIEIYYVSACLLIVKRTKETNERHAMDTAIHLLSITTKLNDSPRLNIVILFITECMFNDLKYQIWIQYFDL